MRHADAATLDRLDDLLGDLRQLDGLVEKKRGVFYRRSRAFLHFHDDPSGLFADVRLDPQPGADFERLRVTTEREQRSLLAKVRGVL